MSSHSNDSDHNPNRSRPVSRGTKIVLSVELWKRAVEQWYDSKVHPYLHMVHLFLHEQLVEAVTGLPPVAWAIEKGNMLASNVTASRRATFALAGFVCVYTAAHFGHSKLEAHYKMPLRRYHHQMRIAEVLSHYELLVMDHYLRATGTGRLAEQHTSLEDNATGTDESDDGSEEGSLSDGVSTADGSEGSTDSAKSEKEDKQEARHVAVGAQKIAEEVKETLKVAVMLNCRGSLTRRLRLMLQRFLIAEIVLASKGIDPVTYTFKLTSTTLKLLADCQEEIPDILVPLSLEEEAVVTPHLPLLAQLQAEARAEGWRFAYRRIAGLAEPSSGVKRTGQGRSMKDRFLFSGILTAHFSLFMVHSLLTTQNGIQSSSSQVLLDATLPVKDFLFVAFKQLQTPLNFYLSSLLKSYIENEVREDLYTRMAGADQWVTDVVGPKTMQIYGYEVEARIQSFRSKFAKTVKPLSYVATWYLNLRHAKSRGLAPLFWMAFFAEGVPAALGFREMWEVYEGGYELYRLDEKGPFRGVRTYDPPDWNTLIEKQRAEGTAKKNPSEATASSLAQSSGRAKHSRKKHFGLEVLAAAISTKDDATTGAPVNLRHIALGAITQPRLAHLKVEADPASRRKLCLEVAAAMEQHTKFLRQVGVQLASKYKPSLGARCFGTVFRSSTKASQRRLRFLLGSYFPKPRLPNSDQEEILKASECCIGDADNLDLLALAIRTGVPEGHDEQEEEDGEGGGGDGKKDQHQHGGKYDYLLDPEEEQWVGHPALLHYDGYHSLFGINNFIPMRTLGLEVVHAHQFLASASRSVLKTVRESTLDTTQYSASELSEEGLYTLVFMYVATNIFCQMYPDNFEAIKPMLAPKDRTDLEEKGPSLWCVLHLNSYCRPMSHLVDEFYIDQMVRDAFQLSEFYHKIPVSIDDLADVKGKRFDPRDGLIAALAAGGGGSSDEAADLEGKVRQEFLERARRNRRKWEGQEGTKDDVPLFEMRRVSFQYPSTPSINTLHDVSLRIPSSGLIGIIGETGSGKTTLFKMLLRLYDPRPPVAQIAPSRGGTPTPQRSRSPTPPPGGRSRTPESLLLTQEDIALEKLRKEGGQVEFDGIPFPQYSTSYLRQCLAVVGQNPFILDRQSFYTNIAFGCNPPPTLAQVVKAAQDASLHDTIMQRDARYDELISKDKLSGGEVQRLALARAFVREPDILLVDEATSALDVITERQIIKAIIKFSESRTVISISHRLATLKAAKYIISMHNGHCVQQGSPMELLRQPEGDSNVYRRYVEKQRLVQQQREEMKRRKTASTTIGSDVEDDEDDDQDTDIESLLEVDENGETTPAPALAEADEEELEESQDNDNDDDEEEEESDGEKQEETDEEKDEEEEEDHGGEEPDQESSDDSHRDNEVGIQLNARQAGALAALRRLLANKDSEENLMGPSATASEEETVFAELLKSLVESSGTGGEAAPREGNNSSDVDDEEEGSDDEEEEDFDFTDDSDLLNSEDVDCGFERTYVDGAQGHHDSQWDYDD